MSHAQSCECEFKSGATAAADSREKDAYQAENKIKNERKRKSLEDDEGTETTQMGEELQTRVEREKKILEHS